MAYFEDMKRKMDREREKQRKAVALSYELQGDPAPKVVATGKDQIAETIIAIAKEQGIPIHEDENLAEVLEALEVDSYIPLEAYAAVAEILNYVYKANAHKRKG